MRLFYGIKRAREERVKEILEVCLEYVRANLDDVNDAFKSSDTTGVLEVNEKQIEPITEAEMETLIETL